MSATPPEAAPTCYRHAGRETWIRCQRCERPICPDCMVSAAVGFQCPDCVKQGARQTRSGMAAYGGRRSVDPRRTSFTLIGLNVLVFALMWADTGLQRLLPIRPDGVCVLPGGRGAVVDSATCSGAGGTFQAGVADGAAWQVVSSVFAHVELLHLGFNMLALYFLGPMLEAALGRVRFLAVYLFSGLAGSALVMLLSEPYAQTLGASGAIFGLMGALLVVGAKVGANLQTIGFWLLLNLAFTFTAGAAISWQGHIGGLVGGALAAAIIVFAPKQNRAAFQWTGLGLATLVVVAVIAVRAASL